MQRNSTAKQALDPSPKKRLNQSVPDVIFKWILILPATIAVIALLVFPFLFTFVASFTDWHLFNLNAPINFVGFKMWASVLTSSYIHTTTWNTIYFVGLALPLQFLLGLTVALALNAATFGRTFFRVFFLMPLMFNPIAVVFLIGKLMLQEDIGPINDVLMGLGFPRIMWLSNPAMAKITIVLVDVWQHTAFMILMFLAGLQSLPQEPFEAAVVDGATAVQRFRYISLPLLGPVALTAVLIRGLDAFKVVDIIYSLTGGGPGQATESITLTVFRMGVKGGDIAFGSAASYLLLIMMAVFTALVLFLTRKWVRISY